LEETTTGSKSILGFVFARQKLTPNIDCGRGGVGVPLGVMRTRGGGSFGQERNIFWPWNPEGNGPRRGLPLTALSLSLSISLSLSLSLSLSPLSLSLSLSLFSTTIEKDKKPMKEKGSDSEALKIIYFFVSSSKNFRPYYHYMFWLLGCTHPDAEIHDLILQRISLQLDVMYMMCRRNFATKRWSAAETHTCN
jgi:hypothetical protein